VNREFLNVRRFRNPLGEAVERVRERQGQRRIPPRHVRPNTGDAQAAGVSSGNLGLSRSLQEGETRRNGVGGVRWKDDSNVERGEAERDVELLLERMWRRGERGELLVSNE
jgi:hypothetical protein